MDEQPNLREFIDEVSSFDEGPAPKPARSAAPDLSSVGEVIEIAGSGSRIRMKAEALNALQSHSDPAVATSGQVGSQVKMVVGNAWLIANVRTLAAGDDGIVMGQIDFLGEGTRDGSGRMSNFRRGVTRYPIPGCAVLPVTTEDLRSVFAADDSPHIEIGTVYPTDDIRGALYVDPMLSKHFAVLGSIGTGKSTAVSLILHRVSELSPEGHIVMIDPHGEYSTAFKDCGKLFNIDNLQLPYWLMNFEEHCEVLLTTHGADRQRDGDILAKCLLAARIKGKDMSQYGKVTVDSPIPYLLTDLGTILTNEMGKLDRAGDTLPYARLKQKLDEAQGRPALHLHVFRHAGVGFDAELPVAPVPASRQRPPDLDCRRLRRSVRDHLGGGVGARPDGVRLCDLVADRGSAPAAAGLRGGAPLRSQGGNSSGQAVRKILAKEGRKYGVSLGLITQRPSDLAEGVLSQCGTIIAMRLNNERDQACVRAAMPEGARGFLDAIPALRNRECIVCGEGVSIPIRVRFDDLEPEKRPATSDPSFAALWRETGGEEGIIQRTIKRWRGHGR